VPSIKRGPTYTTKKNRSWRKPELNKCWGDKPGAKGGELLERTRGAVGRGESSSGNGAHPPTATIAGAASQMKPKSHFVDSGLHGHTEKGSVVGSP